VVVLLPPSSRRRHSQTKRTGSEGSHAGPTRAAKSEKLLPAWTVDLATISTLEGSSWSAVPEGVGLCGSSVTKGTL